MLKCHRRLYRSGYYANSQRVSTSPNANSQSVGTAIGNSHVGPALDGNSQSVGPALNSNSHVNLALDGNSQSVWYDPRWQLTRCEYEAHIGRGQTHSGLPLPLRMRSVEAHPEISKAGCKDGYPCKGLHDVRIRSRYHQDLADMGSRLRQSCQLLGPLLR